MATRKPAASGLRRLVSAALCALAACQVSTEGAPCHEDASCPRGQRCGADLRCSVKAAQCTQCADGETACVEGGVASCLVAPDGTCRSFGEPVAPGPHQVCDGSAAGAAKLVCASTSCAATGLACAPDGVTWLTCDVDGDRCFYAAQSAACTGGLVCGAAGSCVCPATAGTFRVDPFGGSEANASPAPTGADSPAICRFRALGPAVTAANARAQGGAGATATVLVSATGGTPPFVFAEAVSDLRPGVTLTSDAPTQPGAPPASFPYVLELPGPGPLTLHEGATLSGFEVRPGVDLADGIATACAGGATAAAVVQDAKVLGTNGSVHFTNGVHQKGECPLTVARAALVKNGSGVRSAGGTLVVEKCKVTGGQTGILLDLTGSSAVLVATMSDNEISGAAETGIQLVQVAPTSTVTFTGNTILGNCATQQYTVLGQPRQAGGILVLGTAPALTFTGNTLSGNGWDQVLVNVGSGSLDLRGGSSLADCGSASANQFCPDMTADPLTVRGVGVSSTPGVDVDARFNAWSSDAAPAQNTDFVGGNVTTGTSTGKYCPNLRPCPSVLATCPPP